MPTGGGPATATAEHPEEISEAGFGALAATWGGPRGRGLHSSTILLNVSTFCGIRWVHEIHTVYEVEPKSGRVYYSAQRKHLLWDTLGA